MRSCYVKIYVISCYDDRLSRDVRHVNCYNMKPTYFACVTLTNKTEQNEHYEYEYYYFYQSNSNWKKTMCTCSCGLHLFLMTVFQTVKTYKTETLKVSKSIAQRKVS